MLWDIFYAPSRSILFQKMITGVLLVTLIFGQTLAWDGCRAEAGWRCGDICIGFVNACNCGGTILQHTSLMWCCQETNCTGKGEYDEYTDSWPFVHCINGTVLNLTQPCNGTCNYHKDDQYRNRDGVQRSHVPCQVANLKTTQCIPEHEERDGVFNCKNRADEEPFVTGFGNSSSLLLDLVNILTPCNGEWGAGFTCSGFHDVPHHCLPLYLWCSHSYTYTCDELAGKTATGKTIDPQMCSNQTFWEGKKNCDVEKKCNGSDFTPCQFLYLDCSSEIKTALDGDCGMDLMCTARGLFTVFLNTGPMGYRGKICVEKKFQCDNFLQCLNAEDEMDCEEEYVRKGIFTRNDQFLCPSPYLVTSTDENKTGKFFPMRAIRCAAHHLQLSHHDYNYDDGAVQLRTLLNWTLLLMISKYLWR